MRLLLRIILSVFILLSPLFLDAGKLKVLYLGNSHTFWHNLPQLTANLALANGDTIEFAANTPGGCTLAHPSNGHLFNSTSLMLIDSTDWDYVVLQEHSLFAVIDHYKNTYTYPGAKVLDSLIKENYACSKTILQLIWGKKSGGQHCINSYCSITFDDFSHMQDSLTSEYLRLGDTIESIVAPTGVAWQQSINNGDPIELFDPDESHPSLAGHYLTACVYYAVMFRKSTAGIQYFGGLNPADALYLQQIADDVVFSDPDLWNMNGFPPQAGFDYIQFGGTVSFIDQSVGADHYYWDFGDGNHDSIQNPIHTYTATGQYIVKQTVTKNCITDYQTDTLDIAILEIGEITDNSVHPIIRYTPSSGQITIKGVELKEVALLTMSGICVYNSGMLNNEAFSFSASVISKGIYIVRITTPEGLYSRKLLFH